MKYKIVLVLFVLGMWTPSAYADCNGYTVKYGDTLAKIAKAHGTTYPELARLNRIADPNKIYEGQCLQVGSGSATVATVKPTGTILKGIALLRWDHREDIAALGASAFYGWGEFCNKDNDPRCINMVRSMQMPGACYTRLLVGNEPNAVEPFGAPISPENAVNAVKAIQSTCPQTKLIIGNVSAENWGSGTGLDWLRAFLKSYPTYTGAIGVHCYTQASAQWCLDRLTEFRKLYKGELWLTETNILTQDTGEWTKLLNGVKALGYAAIFPYTNRNDGGAYDLPGSALVNNDGSLTPKGGVYAGY